MSARTPARSRQALMSPKSTSTAGGWRAKVRKGMKDVCHADMVDEAVQKVMDAPDSKVDAARDRFCPPYKPALWSQFLTEVLGRPVAARLLSDGDSSARSPASPVRAMRPFSPQPTSAPRGGRSGVGAHRVSKDRAPSSLEYVAVTSLGLIVLVMALAFAPGGLAAVEKKTRVFLRLFADAVGWRDETVQWLIKVLTVGGTLALSGAVVGAVIMGLVSIIVYAVFASR